MKIIKAQVRDLLKLEGWMHTAPAFDVLLSMESVDGVEVWFTDKTYKTEEEAKTEMERLKTLSPEELDEMSSMEIGLSYTCTTLL